MKISVQWLREWVSPRLDVPAMAERLTNAGLEVGAISPVAPALERVVVGEILSVAPHPSAERLRCCRVRVARDKVLDIVCGAPNAVAGMRAPLALPGARLPNGSVVGETDIRGVRSAGMLCSAQELGLEESSHGIMELTGAARVGASLAEALALDDQVLEIDLTPNRGDCLSVAGIARELAALTGARLRAPRVPTARVTSKRRVAVTLDAPQDCPHYAGRVLEDIDAAAPTPLWMKERLRRGGIRSIHPVVDVTNYVMLELGQPMHAFDLERVRGAIRVRHARAGDALTLLDGRQIEPPSGSVLIADERGPLALAGIMGGAASAVSATTRHLFLESAYFRPESIAGRARALGLQTESSQRFERGVDPALQRRALERATELLRGIVGGRPGPVVEATARRHLPAVKPIALRRARVRRVLGTELGREDCETILRRLGMRSARMREGWRVTAPSYRFDIRREEDLIEELARLHGYARLPATLPVIGMAGQAVPEGEIAEARLRTLLVDRDYQEVITYSFVDPALAHLLAPHEKPITLANPIAADMAAMRTSLWPGLLQTVVYNQNRQQTRVRVFELGSRFRTVGNDIGQEAVLAGAVMGPVLRPQWGEPARESDFFDIKGDVSALLQLGGQEHRFRAQAWPGLHPGQSAVVELGDRQAGVVGRLDPAIQAKLGLDRVVFLFELAVDALRAAVVPVFREISKYPSIRRDLAVIVPEATPAQVVLDLARKVAGKLLVNLELFDQYRGKGIDSGRKSLALGLTLQDSSRTLKDSEVEAVISRVVSAFESELGAQLRR